MTIDTISESIFEIWMLMAIHRWEIDEVARFRALTSLQRHMIESACKELGKYTEGVLINADGQFLFRNTKADLALPIALAMTEYQEKVQRRRVMQKRGCTELQAAMLLAEQLKAGQNRAATSPAL